MIKVKIRPEHPVKIKLPEQSRVDVGVSPYQIIEQGEIETYSGPYEVDPSFDQQVLPTKEKQMSDDVTVKAIIVSRTSNQSGGNTVYIGGIIDG